MKNTIKTIFLTLLYSFSGMIVSIFISMIYVRLNTYYYGYNTTNQIQEYFDSDIYKIGINNFLNNNYLYIGLIIFCLFMPYLLKKYYQKNTNIVNMNFNSYLLIIILGMLVSGISNILFYQINNIINFTNTFKISEVSMISLIIVSGILIPILEEYLFRGVVYNQLQKENDKMMSIIVTSVLYSVIASTIDGMIYSFGLSFLLIYVYEKYKTIKAPIILHVTSSIFQILFIYILGISNVMNYILLIIFTLLLALYYIFVIKKDKNIKGEVWKK